MVLRAIATFKETWVVAGRRHHAQHLACRRLDGDNGSNLSFQHLFAKCLQTHVKAKRQIVTRTWTTVVTAIHVMSLHTTVRVTQQDLHTLLATQVLLIASFHTKLANVITRLVIGILIDVRLRHL